MRYLLDTNVFSYLIRGEGGYGAKFKSLNPSHVKTSAMSVFELQYGIKKKNNKKLTKLVNSILENIEVLPFNSEAAMICAEICSDMKTKGKHHPVQDMVIASIALRHDLVLITHNTKDFINVPGLQVEDWYEIV